jgi:large subunit ribosomal protein L25
MERPLLTAEVRQGIGKEIAKKLRAKGLIPAIFYGPRTETIPLVVNPKDFSKALQTEAGENVLIELEIHKAEESSRKVVMVKDIQIDPLQRTTLHADFYEVAMDAMVTVDIPVHLIGKAEGVKVGGILEQVQRVIQIQCLPGDIPRGIDVDVNALGIGDSIHVREIQIEKGMILSDGNLTIATVVHPVAEVKPVEEVAPEAVAEEGEAKEEKEEEK